MDINKLCLGCMKEIADRESRTTCPYCGYQLDKKAEPHQLQPGTILKGKYYIGKVLGEGGFGITYIGLDLNLQIPLAIKEFFPNGFVSRNSEVSPQLSIHVGSGEKDVEKWRNNFIREAQTLAKFHDLDGIVKVYEFFQENNTAYIVMEYVEGIDLKTYLKQNGGKIPADQAFMMLEPVIVSLEQIHQKGIIHRDISPDNIRLTANGKMKLLDFGAARDVSGNAEKSLSVMLKHGYAPEEQYRTRGNQGPWSDVYALCATIYRAITGKKPVEAMERLRNDTLQKPSALGVAINPVQEEALMMGLAVVMENRIQSMKALHQAIYNMQIPTGVPGWGGAAVVPPVNTAQNTGYNTPDRTAAYTTAGQTAGYTTAGQGAGFTTAGQTVGYTTAGQGNGYTTAGQTVGYTTAGQTTGYTTAGQGAGYTTAGQNTGYQNGQTGAYNNTAYNTGNNANGGYAAGVTPGGASAQAGGQASTQSSGGNGALIGILAGVFGLVAVIVIVVVALGSGGRKSSSVPSRVTASVTQEKEEPAKEEAKEKEEPAATDTASSEKKDDALQYLTDMAQEGKYTDIIDDLLYGDGSRLKGYDDEKAQILSDALTGLEDQCKSQCREHTDSGDYLGAYDVLNDTLTYFNGISGDCGEASGHITNLNDFYDVLYEEDLTDFRLQCESYANAGDLDAISTYVSENSDRFRGDALFEQIVDDNYKNCVVHKAINLHGGNGNSRDDKATVNFIYDYLELSGFNFYMMELYEDSANTLGLFSYAGNANQLPATGASGYVIEGSDQYYLSESDVYYMDFNTMRCALHEIYARHGRSFVNSIMQSYFSGKSWYSNRNLGDIRFDESELNDVERYNVELIINCMKELGYLRKI